MTSDTHNKYVYDAHINSTFIASYGTSYFFVSDVLYRILIIIISTLEPELCDKMIAVQSIAPHHPHRLTRNQCLESFEMTDVEFNTAFPLVQHFLQHDH